MGQWNAKEVVYNRDDLSRVSPELQKICHSPDVSDKYHCETLKRLLFCANNRARGVNEPHFNNYCNEKNGFLDDPYYSSDRAIYSLMKDKYSPKEIVDTQRGFGYVYDNPNNDLVNE